MNTYNLTVNNNKYKLDVFDHLFFVNQYDIEKQAFLTKYVRYNTIDNAIKVLKELRG